MDAEEQAEQIVSLLIFDSETAADVGEATEQWRHRIATALASARRDALMKAAAVAKDYSWTLPMYESREMNEATDDAACYVQEAIAAALEALAEEE